jgi:adenylate kinase family enzyme
MKTCRNHIMGASGAGVTSLGRALADALASTHHDSDDYFWKPTIPPYREKRVIADRLRLMHEMFLQRADWVLTGSLEGWGDPILPFFDLVVFLFTPTGLRLERLRAREARHFGIEAIAPGGWRHREFSEFIEWASQYEDGRRVGRNLARHEQWLASLRCSVLRLDGAQSTAVLVEDVVRKRARQF